MWWIKTDLSLATFEALLTGARRKHSISCDIMAPDRCAKNQDVATDEE